MLKILHVDIETAPVAAYVWGLWKNNVGTNQIMSDWFMLTWSAKWHHEPEMYGDRLYSQEALDQDDKRIMYSLWKLLDEADVVIGHNGDKFDIPKINTRFVLNGMSPPSPYRSVDTLKIAKRKFKFSSNRLDYLGQLLGVGRKIDTGGFQLWTRCMQGEDAALQEMLDYNQQDVLLLEDVYDKLMPFASIHPSHTAAQEDLDDPTCPKCGSDDLHKRGYAYTNMSKFQRFRCNDCSSWSRSRINERSKNDMHKTLMPI